MRQDHDGFEDRDVEVRVPVIVSREAFSRIRSLRHSVTFRAAIGPLIGSLGRKPVELASLRLDGLGHLALHSGPASLSARPYQGCHWIFSVAPTFMVPAAPDEDPDDPPPGGGQVVMLRGRAKVSAVGFDLDEERTAVAGTPAGTPSQMTWYSARYEQLSSVTVTAHCARVSEEKLAGVNGAASCVPVVALTAFSPKIAFVPDCKWTGSLHIIEFTEGALLSSPSVYSSVFRKEGSMIYDMVPRVGEKWSTIDAYRMADDSHVRAGLPLFLDEGESFCGELHHSQCSLLEVAAENVHCRSIDSRMVIGALAESHVGVGVICESGPMEKLFASCEPISSTASTSAGRGRSSSSCVRTVAPLIGAAGATCARVADAEPAFCSNAYSSCHA